MAVVGPEQERRMPMKRRKKIELGCAVALWGLMCTGCRKDLCYNHDEHSPSVRVFTEFSWDREWERPYGYEWKRDWPADWDVTYDELRPDPSQGVRALVYSSGKGYTEDNHPAGGGKLTLKEGVSSILFYNNDTEFILFNELNAVASASATTRTVYRNSLEDLHPNERTMRQPDMLYGHFEPDYVAERKLEKVILPVTMKPLVYTYLIRYRFTQGLQYVALARGAIAGMAENVYLKDGHTGDLASTILYDARVKPDGVEARVLTFGVPNYPGDHFTRGDGTPAHFALNLEVRLRNGTFKSFSFDVTEQLLKQPRGGVVQVEGLEITEEEGDSGENGFDVDVDDWGDRIDIPLPIL